MMVPVAALSGSLTGSKPASWQQFKQRMSDHGMVVEDSDKTRRHFETSQVALLNDLRNNGFFQKLPAHLERMAEKYLSRTRTPLFLHGSLSTFELQKKGYDSAIDKAYRLNVAWNRNWPRPPTSGEWVGPHNWHEHLDDLVRGILVCKYMDGPHLTCEGMKQLASEAGVDADYSSRQLDNGYYAYHFYLTVPVEFVDQDWEMKKCNLKVEVQVTTQLQELGRSLTHEGYVKRRSQLSQDKNAWKWDHSSDQFKAGYIAHTLHLIEGLILDMRNKSLSGLASTSAEGERNE
jgi:hypothetical protein